MHQLATGISRCRDSRDSRLRQHSKEKGLTAVWGQEDKVGMLKPWDAKKVGMAHCPSSFHGAGLQGSPLSSVLICHLLPSLLSCPHPPPDLGPVKSLELSKYSMRSAEAGRAVKGTVGCWALLFADHCPIYILSSFPASSHLLTSLPLCLSSHLP